MRNFLVPFLAALFMALPSVGCGDGSILKGDLLVDYRVGSGSSTCADVKIQSIRVHVMKDDTEIAAGTFDCAPANQTVTLRYIDEGTYDVKVDGLAGNGDVTYSGRTDNFEVVGDQVSGPVMVVLDQILPSLLLWFDFDDIGGCTKFGVTQIRLVLYKDGASSIRDTTTECAVQMNESVLINGLSDTATYDLRVRGLNAAGDLTYEYNRNDIVLNAGPPTELTVVLSACNGLCTAP